MEELLCEIHACPLKHMKIVVGTINDGWYCNSCKIIYVSNSSISVNGFVYNGKRIEFLSESQEIIAQQYLQNMALTGIADDLYDDNEKTLGIQLICGECREAFYFSKEEQLNCLQNKIPAPKKCPKCLDKSAREKEMKKKEIKYRGVRQTMKHDNTRHIDANGRQVNISGGDANYLAEEYIPKHQSI